MCSHLLVLQKKIRTNKAKHEKVVAHRASASSLARHMTINICRGMEPLYELLAWVKWYNWPFKIDTFLLSGYGNALTESSGKKFVIIMLIPTQKISLGQIDFLPYFYNFDLMPIWNASCACSCIYTFVIVNSTFITHMNIILH